MEAVGFIGKYFFYFVIPSQIRCGNIIGQILQCYGSKFVDEGVFVSEKFSVYMCVVSLLFFHFPWNNYYLQIYE